MSGMITVYGRRSSINVQKVLWTLAELGQPFERVTVAGSFGGTRTPEFLAMNPNALVPVLKDGDIAMFESNAIVRYLAARYGTGTLRPEDPARLAAAEQWMEWQATTIAPLVSTIFMNLVRTPADRRDEAAIHAAMAKLPGAFAIADAHLERNSWFAGNALTMAEIVLGCMYWRYRSLECEKEAAPNIDRWFGQLQLRKPYRDWVMVPIGRNPEEWSRHERELG
jgi:glutathione S-transferase